MLPIFVNVALQDHVLGAAPNKGDCLFTGHRAGDDDRRRGWPACPKNVESVARVVFQKQNP